MHNQEKFEYLRKRYPEFIYEKYDIIEEEQFYKLIFTFEIPILTTFNPTITIPKKDRNGINLYIFTAKKLSFSANFLLTYGYSGDNIFQYAPAC